MARPLEMGESLTGSYLSYVRKCDFVVYGTRTEEQGEIDVVGFQVERRRVWLCEVATHLDGLQYGKGGRPTTVRKVRQKVMRAVEFGDRMFPSQEKHFELWAPKAGPTLMADLDDLAHSLGSEETDVTFVVNDRYAKRVGELVRHARVGTQATPEPFFRSLQILAHLSGHPMHWAEDSPLS